jgi:hypothetical protein
MKDRTKSLWTAVISLIVMILIELACPGTINPHYAIGLFFGEVVTSLIWVNA